MKTAYETDDFVINGGKQLSGSITVNPSKNGALHLICTALLNKGKTTLHNIPKIAEVERMIEVLESIGVKVTWLKKHSILIEPPKKFSLDKINKESAGKMRSTLMLIGVLVHFLNDFRLPHAGGCQMGERTIGAHRYGLEPFGIKIKTEEDAYKVTCKKPKPAELTMYEASDTGTTNVLRASALITKPTIVHFATQNYMVQDVIGLLKHFGVTIEQVGPASLKITGVEEINQDFEYWNSEDPIEAMAFITAGLITKSTLTITRCPLEFLRLEILKIQKMGGKLEISKPYLAKNNFTTLVDITVKPSSLRALPDKIHPLPYPGVNVDNLPFFVPIACLAEGKTLVHDWMWENRAIYFTYLNQLGAKIDLADPHRVYIEGVKNLKGNQITCPPALRPAMTVLLAMLSADGQSILRNVYSIKRGYEDLPKRLASIGADIKELK